MRGSAVPTRARLCRLLPERPRHGVAQHLYNNNHRDHADRAPAAATRATPMRSGAGYEPRNDELLRRAKHPVCFDVKRAALRTHGAAELGRRASR